jgi:2-succinyl-6-hydroxy-2,4-cyclohexadiene-1-carboxylate synthase
MSFIEINGINYHIQQQGSGQPMVFLHGFTGCSDNWQPITSHLSDHYATLAIDLLGHGKTDCPPDPLRYRMEHAAEDLHKLIQSVLGEPVHLVGYSLGGRLALYFAVHYPQWLRRLTLESASPGLATPAERDARRLSDEQLAQRIEQDGIQAFVEEWEALPLFDSQKRLAANTCKRFHKQRLQNNPVGLANSLRGMGSGVQPSLWEHLHQITVPTSLIVGHLDPKFTAIAEQMSEAIPKTTLTVVPDAGHTIHLEQPAAFRQALLTKN